MSTVRRLWQEQFPYSLGSTLLQQLHFLSFSWVQPLSFPSSQFFLSLCSASRERKSHNSRQTVRLSFLPAPADKTESLSHGPRRKAVPVLVLSFLLGSPKASVWLAKPSHCTNSSWSYRTPVLHGSPVLLHWLWNCPFLGSVMGPSTHGAVSLIYIDTGMGVQQERKTVGRSIWNPVILRSYCQIKLPVPSCNGKLYGG